MRYIVKGIAQTHRNCRQQSEAAWRAVTRCVLPLAGVGILAVIQASPSAAQGINSGGQHAPQICQRVLAHDYLRPLRSMHPIRRPPKSGRLPFGPAYLRLSSSSPLLVGRDSFGYNFSSNLTVRRPTRLGWLVVTRLVRVNRAGRAIKTFGAQKHKLGRVPDINAVGVFTPVPKQPAFYRYDIEFWQDGVRLGSYSEYLRVVKPVTAVQLRASADSYSPGSTAWFRLENLGSTPIIFGLLYSIERFTGTNWVRDPSSRESAPAVAIEISGGLAYKCNEVHLSSNLMPGLYRFSQKVKAIRSGRTLNPYAEFEVVG
jgi:Bacterial Ig-like domain